jgi:hypothetical protein
LGEQNFQREIVDILSKGSIVDLESVRAKILEILESGDVQPYPHCRKQMRIRNLDYAAEYDRFMYNYL